MNIFVKYIVDECGIPKEVIMSIDDFRKIEELLGWDLDDDSIRELREARNDKESGNKDAYIDLESI